MVRSRGRYHCSFVVGWGSSSKDWRKARGSQVRVMAHMRTGEARARAYGVFMSFFWKGVGFSGGGALGSWIVVQKDWLGAMSGERGRDASWRGVGKEAAAVEDDGEAESVGLRSEEADKKDDCKEAASEESASELEDGDEEGKGGTSAGRLHEEPRGEGTVTEDCTCEMAEDEEC